MSTHINKHEKAFEEAVSLDTRITNGAALVSTMLKMPTTHFQSPQMRALFELVGEMARHDCSFMEKYDKLTGRSKIGATIEKLASDIHEVS